VYSILTAQLVATAVLSSISFFSATFKTWIQSNSWMMFLSLFGSFGLLFATYWKRKSYPTNLIFLAGFTGLEAYTVAVVTSFYDSRIVLQAVIITGALFVALTLFACQTKYDFSSWYTYLYGVLWLLIISGFVMIFFPNNGVAELVYSSVAALLFSAYIVSSLVLVDVPENRTTFLHCPG
jgi:FtsH-binding integral membrane protein